MKNANSAAADALTTNSDKSRDIRRWSLPNDCSDGRPKVHTLFGVGGTMTVEVIIGNKVYIDQCVRGILHMEKKIVTLHSWSVTILLAAKRSQERANILYESLPVEECITSDVILVAKHKKI